VLVYAYYFILFCWSTWTISAGTGNKVEDFSVGFTQKYGDGVDLSPIADLMKSEVFMLAAYLKVPDSF
jgi:NAD+ synthase